MSISVFELIARMAQYNQSSDDWARKNPVLLAGEIGVESDTRRVKVGDGESPWLELDYWSFDGMTYIGSESEDEHNGIYVDDYVISADLLYERLRMPNFRIKCHDPNTYSIHLSIGCSDDTDVYTEE